ncbi:MAG: aminopeptidase N [Gammaproteobacteria bacterium]
MTSAPETKYRKDYTAPACLVHQVELTVDIRDRTQVEAELQMERNPASVAGAPLKLDGENLKLLSLEIDGTALGEGDYKLHQDGLTIPTPPDRFVLKTRVEIDPDNNTALEGLYRSDEILCTQCEAEGFRHITYYPDRPDVMAAFRTTIHADKSRYPVLLCNGNPVDRGGDGDRHWVTWEDPYPKPSYLFALVAGDLACVEDSYTTGSGRHVALRFYVDHGNESRSKHAMESLKRAMTWDERVYGLEYDLDIYMVVAVSAFNMGAMENKGLNLFNDRFVLADDTTATDEDYLHIEDVIAHEYFHNWTGNRVTLRDWFQLSLKESLTVFREQSFSADQGLAAVKRIGDVRMLRRMQFPEDASPMAHPVRPESYIEMNNFYTATVYEKGAEVIRMMHTILGDALFVRGVQDYLSRYDGRAVTIEDFVATLEESAGADLRQFRLWYSQAGTPRLEVTEDYDAEEQVYTLNVRQELKPTPGQKEKQPMHIPLVLGLIDDNGDALTPVIDTDADVTMQTETQALVHLREAETVIRFRNCRNRPVASLLRGFSAPVILDPPHSETDLHFLVRHDSDPFCRWDACQQVLLRAALRAVETIQGGGEPAFETALGETFAELISGPIEDDALTADMLSPPGETYIAEQMDVIDPGAVVAAHQALKQHLAAALGERLEPLYESLSATAAYTFDAANTGRRRLQRVIMEYLGEFNPEALARHCRTQYEQADNMTDMLASLAAVNNLPGETRESLFADFERRWRDNALVMDKWFRLQATARREDILEHLETLMRHPIFSLRNPNRLRAVIGAFSVDNMPGLHRADGSGYRFIADYVLKIDQLNGQMSARLAGSLARWRRYEPERSRLMRAELERIAGTETLSSNLYEVVSKSLEEETDPGTPAG